MTQNSKPKIARDGSQEFSLGAFPLKKNSETTMPGLVKKKEEEILPVGGKSFPKSGNGSGGGEDLQDRTSLPSPRAAEYAKELEMQGGQHDEQDRASWSSRAAGYATDNQDAKGKTGQRTCLASERAAEYATEKAEGTTDLEGHGNLATTNYLAADGSTIQPMPDLQRNRRTRPEPVPGAHRQGRDSRLPPEDDEENQWTVATEEPEGGRRRRVSDSDLARAQPVADNSGEAVGEAQPVDEDQLAANLAAKEVREKQCRMVGYVAFAVSLVVVIISLVVGLKAGPEPSIIISTNNATNMTESPTLSPTIQPPPMENLELLYESIPQSTKDNLYDTNSSQWKAWKWLMSHQNITNLSEQRKKQIFVMTTFYYSFEGPSWPIPSQGNWLNDTVNECHWINTDVKLLMGMSRQYLKDRRYYDYRPCNDNGELQTLFLMHLQLQNKFPLVPPEISLLPSVSIIGCMYCGLSVPLEDIMIPEVTQLPKLELLVLHDNSLHGTIPNGIGAMTSLKNIALSKNKLTGWIPSDIIKLTKLKQIHNGGNLISGPIPSQLGLMTSLTDLKMWDSLLTGTLPTELGHLTRIRNGVSLYGNLLHGPIPSEFGMIKNVSWVSLWGMSLTGTIPPELGMISRVKELELQMNSLTGTIPSELGKNTRIEFLGLSHNFLFGSIPSQMGRLSNTTSLLLGNNSLAGSIPEEFWNLTKLESLYLGTLPELSGSIPAKMCRPQSNETCSIPLGAHHQSPDLTKCHLEFDCTELLCGCDCQCPGNTLSSNQTEN